MKFLKKRSAKVAVMTVGLVAIAAPAFAANYNFSADFTHKLDSGSWSQGSGKDTFSFHCTAKYGEDYTVTLYKENALADTNEGSKTFTCNSTDDSYTWSNLPGDDYHITFTKAQDNVHIIGSGTMSHPST